jgi:hypothetical protein
VPKSPLPNFFENAAHPENQIIVSHHRFDSIGTFASTCLRIVAAVQMAQPALMSAENHPRVIVNRRRLIRRTWISEAGDAFQI